MILQALTQYYEDLVKQDKIARPGWAMQKVSYALCIGESGELEQVVPLLEETEGKKPQPQTLRISCGTTAVICLAWMQKENRRGASNALKPAATTITLFWTESKVPRQRASCGFSTAGFRRIQTHTPHCSRILTRSWPEAISSFV